MGIFRDLGKGLSRLVIAHDRIKHSLVSFWGVWKKFVTYTEKVHPQQQQQQHIWSLKVPPKKNMFFVFEVVFCSPARSEDKNDYQATIVVKENPMGFSWKWLEL